MPTPASAHGAAAARRAVFWDLARVRAARAMLERLDPEAPPTTSVWPPGWQAPASLGVLAGSFNPLTQAHLALARRALAAGVVQAVAYAISVRTVDKERVTGATLPDRLLTLQLAVDDDLRQAVLLLNRGLYVDQARAVRASLPAVTDLVFLIGFDKLVQIFDPRYYTDRDAALTDLFSLARLVVAPRDHQGTDAVTELLARPENRPFARAVDWLPLPKAYARLSSTRVRAAVSEADTVTGVPAATTALLRATSAYAAPFARDGQAVDAYALRLRLLDTITQLPSTVDSELDAGAIWRRALRTGRRAAAVRCWLESPAADPAACRADLLRFQRP